MQVHMRLVRNVGLGEKNKGVIINFHYPSNKTIND